MKRVHGGLAKHKVASGQVKIVAGGVEIQKEALGGQGRMKEAHG